MNPRAIVMSFPVLRRLWRFLPGPLRIPVLAIGAVVGLWYMVRGRKESSEQ